MQAGYYAGGGGGGAAAQGGGLMLRPHVDLLWRFGRQRAGLSWSQVRFANGQHVRLSAAWVRPIPHVPGMGPVTSSLAECL